MPIYDFKCQTCGKEFEQIVSNTIIKYAKCPYCNMKGKKIFSGTGQTFNLKYNPKSDICDWDGNTTRFYDEYNKAKERGENVRIPQLDGDG